MMTYADTRELLNRFAVGEDDCKCTICHAMRALRQSLIDTDALAFTLQEHGAHASGIDTGLDDALQTIRDRVAGMLAIAHDEWRDTHDTNGPRVGDGLASTDRILSQGERES